MVLNKEEDTPYIIHKNISVGCVLGSILGSIQGSVLGSVMGSVLGSVLRSVLGLLLYLAQLIINIRLIELV